MRNYHKGAENYQEVFIVKMIKMLTQSCHAMFQYQDDQEIW